MYSKTMHFSQHKPIIATKFGCRIWPNLYIYIYIYRFPRNFLRTKKLNNINTSIYQMLLRKVQAALLALKLSVHHHLSFVLFEGDSKTVIEALRRSSPQIFLFLLSLHFWLPFKKMLGLLFYT